MLKPLHQLPAIIQAWALFGCALLPITEAFAQTLTPSGELRPAVAAVTSYQGKILHYDSDGNHSAIHLRSILPIDQTFFATKKKGTLFLSLSNGIGLGLGELTRIWIDRYEQSTINPPHESLNFEGSVSNLSVRIETGTLAVAFNHLNPQSLAEFKLPLGRVRVHSGQVLLDVQPDSSCRISVYQGTATFYYAGTEKREFISAGTSFSLSSESTKQSAIDSVAPLGQLPEDRPHLLAAAEYARLRVLYRHNPDGVQPLHEWVLPNGLFDQPSARPYQFDLK
jgi:hypothetical protein